MQPLVEGVDDELRLRSGRLPRHLLFDDCNELWNVRLRLRFQRS
jgi:hypothetical protein